MRSPSARPNWPGAPGTGGGTSSRPAAASGAAVMKGFSPGSRQTIARSAPPGDAAARRLANAAGGSSKNITPNREATTRGPGPKSWRCASAATKGTSRPARDTRSRAAVSMGSETSTPVTAVPAPSRRASARVVAPVPHPTSSTEGMPGAASATRSTRSSSSGTYMASRTPCRRTHAPPPGPFHCAACSVPIRPPPVAVPRDHAATARSAHLVPAPAAGPGPRAGGRWVRGCGAGSLSPGPGAGQGRDGRGVPGVGHAPRALGRAQAAPPPVRRRPGLPAPVPARGGGRGGPARAARRAGARLRGDRRPAVPRHASHRRHRSRDRPGRGPARSPARARPDHAGRRRARCRPRRGSGPPRRQAVERAGGAGRLRPPGRLRHRPLHGIGDRRGLGDRDHGLHGPRAVAGRARRRALRRVLPRLPAARVPHRLAALRRRRPARARRRPPAPAPARPDRRRDPAGAATRHRPRHGEGARGPARGRRGVRRGGESGPAPRADRAADAARPPPVGPARPRLASLVAAAPRPVGSADPRPRARGPAARRGDRRGAPLRRRRDLRRVQPGRGGLLRRRRGRLHRQRGRPVRLGVRHRPARPGGRGPPRRRDRGRRRRPRGRAAVRHHQPPRPARPVRDRHAHLRRRRRRRPPPAPRSPCRW